MDDIDRFLKEDLDNKGDITSDSIFNDETTQAHVIAKESCVVAGLEEIKEVFERTGAQVKLIVDDGDLIKEKTVVARIKGPVRSVLKGERLALNFICRMSGIATETKELVNRCRGINSHVTVAATRKTTPGFRKYEKKAVVLGGGETHRYGLYDAVMIKDNHIKCVGSVKDAINRVKQKVHDKIIEVEIENEKDAIIAAKMNVDVVMLDNLTPKSAKKIAEKIREINNDVLIEISGGINPDNIVDYATFADRISLGHLTHSIKNKNFSLEII